MRKIRSLILLQLVNKLKNSSKTAKQKLFQTIFAVLKIVAVTMAIYLGFYVLSSLRLFSLLPGIPTELFLVIFSIMLILSILVATKGLIGSIYLDKDNFVLLTFPIDRSIVYVSKFVVYFIYEFIRNINYLMPLLIAYFLINKFALVCYLWIIPALILYTLFVLTISSLLSIPMLYVSNFIKYKQWLKVAILLAIIGVATWITVRLILLIPSNFDLRASWGTTFWQIQDMMSLFWEHMWLFRIVLVSMVGRRYGVANFFLKGEQWVSVAVILGMVLVLLVVTVIVIKPIFFKMASSGFEFKKDTKINSKNNKSSGVFITLIKKEFLLLYRNSSKFYSLILVVVFLPMAILLLNKIYGAMDTRLAGNNMGVTFNILLILLIALSSNSSFAKSISEEGASAYLNKISPQSHVLTLSSRLVINAVFVSISMFISIAIFTSFSHINWSSTILIFVFCESLYLGHLLYSLELDIMSPHLDIMTLNVGEKNETKASLMAVILSLIFAFLTYFFVCENITSVWLKVMLVAILFLVSRVYLYISKIKYFYKEAL